MASSHQWLLFALGSAFFAALTAILGKLGVSEINSNFATLIRIGIILIMTLAIVAIRNEWQPISKLSGFGVGMLVLSGVATGLSWLCYYRALQLGPASKVAPIDKLSVALVILFSVVFLSETLTWKIALGGVFITAGAVLIAM